MTHNGEGPQYPTGTGVLMEEEPLNGGLRSVIDQRRRLAADVPVLASPLWLPSGSGFDWLDDLAAEHARLLEARSEASAECAALTQRFEQEDADRRDALTRSIRDDSADPPPAPTPADERRTALDLAAQRCTAANDALDGFLADAISTIEEHAPETLAVIGERADAAEAKRHEAQRLLAEAAALEAGTWRLAEWTRRNAGLHGRRAFRNVPTLRHIGWDAIEASAPLTHDAMEA